MRNEKEEFSNYSIDKKVAFKEEGHKYIHLENPDLVFTSVTTLIAQYKEKFDAHRVARNVTGNPNSKYFGMDPVQLAEDWVKNGRDAAERGTEMHKYGEALLNGRPDIVAPDSPKVKHTQAAVAKLFKDGYKLATTELLVYSEDVSIAGQSDILLKKRRYGSEEHDYMIYDWKFIADRLEKKSFYHPKRGYKLMTGPFKNLMDCAWIHYSIQLALYQTLTGDPAKVTEKVLVIVYDDYYEFVPAYPMRVFWDQHGTLQCVHENWQGRWYDSRMDTLYRKKPKDIVGI